MHKPGLDKYAIWAVRLIKSGLRIIITEPEYWFQSLVMAVLSLMFLPFCWWILPMFISHKRLIIVREIFGLSLRLKWVFLLEIPLVMTVFSGFVMLYGYLWKDELEAELNGIQIVTGQPVGYSWLWWGILGTVYLITVVNALIFYISIKIPGLKDYVAVKVSARQLCKDYMQVVLTVFGLAALIVVYNAHLPQIMSFLQKFITAHITDVSGSGIFRRDDVFLIVGGVYYTGVAVYTLRVLSRYLFLRLLKNLQNRVIKLT